MLIAKKEPSSAVSASWPNCSRPTRFAAIREALGPMALEGVVAKRAAAPGRTLGDTRCLGAMPREGSATTIVQNHPAIAVACGGAQRQRRATPRRDGVAYLGGP